MIRHYPYYEAYRSVSEVFKEQEAKDLQYGTLFKQSVSLNFKRNKTDDKRRYNIPTTVGEIAVVFNGENGEPPTERDFTVHPRNPDNRFSLNTINLLSQHTDPMTYPIVHLKGEPGWRPGLPQVSGKQMSMLQFYSFRLGVRPGFNALHRSGKLFHQYLVDAYTKVQGNILF